MIVSDVMQQAQYDQPLEKSTKVWMTSDLACIKLERIWVQIYKNKKGHKENDSSAFEGLAALETDLSSWTTGYLTN